MPTVLDVVHADADIDGVPIDVDGRTARMVVNADRHARYVTADGIVWQGELVGLPRQTEPGRRRPWSATTVDGATLTFARGHCGCGDPLKRMSVGEVWRMT